MLSTYLLTEQVEDVGICKNNQRIELKFTVSLCWMTTLRFAMVPGVLLAYDVYGGFHFVSVFVESVHHHHGGLHFILLKPLPGTTQCKLY